MAGDHATTARSALPAAVRRPLHGPLFAHASEAELARILDFYAVRWEYEPHIFPILWNLDGAVVESFAPDFYLPDFDTYVELTTLRQPLVRKKNRKLRRLRELYPDIRIKLFYARDFRALMLKYGKLGLVDALSGTSGQVVPADAVRGEEPPAAAFPMPTGAAGPTDPAEPTETGNPVPAPDGDEPSDTPHRATRRRRPTTRGTRTTRATVAAITAAPPTPTTHDPISRGTDA